MNIEAHKCFWCGNNATHQLKNGKWCCSLSVSKCPELRRKNSLGLVEAHKRGKYAGVVGGIPWNKGLTAKTDERVAKRVATIKHRFSTGELKGSFCGRKHSEETKRKMSESMKKAHAEGRAHNIGECRWNNEHSWPEKWFIQVIENEFNDKNYRCEVPFHRFSLDFAWIDKKRCIEVDGNFHEMEEQKKRDVEKDRLLKEEGWKILRMPWKEVCKDTLAWIAKAKAFVDS